MMNALLQALGFAGDVLDTPGAWVRDGLMGRNPFGNTFNPDERASGRDVLENYGMVGENQEGFDAGDVAGFGAEMLLDPTNLVGAGLWGKTAKAAGAATDANRASESLRAMGAMPEEIASLTKVVDDTGKPLRTYHGTPHAFDQYDPAMLDYTSLYGKGIYTTADPALASEYTSKGAMRVAELSGDRTRAIDAVRKYGGDYFNSDEEWQAATDDELFEKAKSLFSQIGPLDGDPMLTELSKEFSLHAPPMNVRMQYMDVRNPFNIDGFLDDAAPAIRSKVESAAGPLTLYGNRLQKTPEYVARVIKDSTGPSSTGQAAWDVMKQRGLDPTETLRELGYDGITHIGGGRIGNKAHQVYIALDPSQVYKPYIAPAMRDVPNPNPILASLLGYNAAMLPERGN